MFVIPVSTVLSKAAFSAGKWMILKKRLRLMPEAVEVCVWNQDWGLVAFQKQDKKSLKDEVISDEETWIFFPSYIQFVWSDYVVKHRS